ncbi:MAG TPA: YdeI/OmpD-associated family protein [Ktedonobacteraceae bacterium]|nr:YdeI/OmpD-associated family protein [Ktedonobacteraceae bacterium]
MYNNLMKSTDKLPIILFATQQDWENWLAEHDTDTDGIWLKLAKKATGIASVNYAEAVDSAICYGWIDGQKASFDDQHWLQKFTPRRPKSMWSKVNCDRATALIAQGRMQPSGLKQVELAKADGRWERAYASQSSITIPADFQSELDKNAKAKDFFSTLDSANRYAILWRIQDAKRPETRTARIQKFIEMLSNNQKIHP